MLLKKKKKEERSEFTRWGSSEREDMEASFVDNILYHDSPAISCQTVVSSPSLIQAK